MKDKMLKIINDNSVPHQSSEYGEGIFTDINAVDDIVESAVKLFSIPIVSTQRETFNSFFEYLDKLSEREYDANSLTGHSEDYLKTI